MYLVGLAAAVLLMGKDFWRTPCLGKSSYQDLEQGNIVGMLVRLGVLVLAVVTATAFLLVLLGRPGAPSAAGGWIAAAGQHTRHPYLLQVLTLVGATEWKSMGSHLDDLPVRFEGRRGLPLCRTQGRADRLPPAYRTQEIVPGSR